MVSNINPSSNGFHHIPDSNLSRFVSPEELVNAIRHSIDSSLLCSENCFHPFMKSPPPGKCDGQCRQRMLNEAMFTLDQLEKRIDARHAARQGQEDQKRRPGGQPGNQNARKYDILPRQLSKSEFAWVKKALSSKSLNMQDDIAVMRVRYVQLMFDPNSKPSDYTQVAHAISNMTRTQALLDKLYGPPTDDEGNNQNDENDSPESGPSP